MIPNGSKKIFFGQENKPNLKKSEKYINLFIFIVWIKPCFMI